MPRRVQKQTPEQRRLAALTLAEADLLHAGTLTQDSWKALLKAEVSSEEFSDVAARCGGSHITLGLVTKRPAMKKYSRTFLPALRSAVVKMKLVITVPVLRMLIAPVPEADALPGQEFLDLAALLNDVARISGPTISLEYARLKATPYQPRGSGLLASLLENASPISTAALQDHTPPAMQAREALLEALAELLSHFPPGMRLPALGQVAQRLGLGEHPVMLAQTEQAALKFL